MDIALGDDLNKIPQKIEHGLSKEEQLWLGKWFESLAKIQNEQLKTLHTINTAIQVVAVIVLLSAILAACGALGLHL